MSDHDRTDAPRSVVPTEDAPWIDPIDVAPVTPAPETDSHACEEHGGHLRATGHRRDECPVEAASNYERESELAFMSRSPDHAASL